MKSLIIRHQSALRYVVFLVITLTISVMSFAQPANDDCGNAQTLTSGTVCTNTAGALRVGTTSATGTAGINTFCGLSSASSDVWYYFIASSASPTITISSLGSSGGNNSMDDSPVLQLFNTVSCTAGVLNVNSNTCVSGTGVASLSLTPVTALTPGSAYLIRVGSTIAVTGTASRWAFNICITDPFNNLCAAAPLLNSGGSCNNSVGTLAGATYTTVTGACGNSGGNRNDVWYRFEAKTTNPTITLSSAPSNRSIQLFSGTCVGGLGALQCSINSNTLTPVTALAIGTIYYVRIFSDNNTTGTFNICITDPAPANNNCSGASLLTSGITCGTPTAGNISGATLSAVTIGTPDCAGTVINDVWYRFVAQTTNPSITLGSISTGFTNPGIQVLQPNDDADACGTPGFTSLFCGTTSVAANFLTPGTIYYIRIFSRSGFLVSAASFTVCIVDPPGAPSNNECTGAINLAVNANCNNAPGTMGGATASSTPLGGTCTGPNAYDVWYRFKAVNSNATITLSSLGTNFTNSGIEILRGTCGSFTSVACASGLTISSSALLTDTTYYVRVYSRTAPPPNGNARFSICITSSTLPTVRFGNSYVNISRKTTGGVVQPGDTLEIRMTINHTSGTMYRLRYVDNIPTHTKMVTGTGNFLGVITNEGLVYKKYTVGADSDPATYLASPPAGHFNIRMNLAFGSSTSGTPPDNSSSNVTTNTAGTMDAGANRPRGGGGMLFATAFRVVVDSFSVGDTISINPGRFIYRTSSSGTDITLTSTPYKILITTPLNLCSNSIGVNNAAESGGTFGSGTTLARSTDLTSPITGYNFVNPVTAYNAVGDGNYSIVKNLSPRNSTTVNARRESQCNVPAALHFDDALNCNNRMYGHWDIGGDHTGTANATGNTPPAASATGGYMLMVNADFVASEIYRQTLNNLCPNTYYEFSAWIKNICPTCGVDSTGDQFTGTATAPTLGYPGVYPNMAFALNGVDYYTTGEVDVTGWQKRGFVFRTGATQTSAVFTIRNNAQGGGGNDWAMDDIAVATCLPTMSYSPTINPNVCLGNTITIHDTISSYFRNYTTYKWQRSTNAGGNWSDITGVTSLADTNYYITSYTIPPAYTTLANDDDRYRVVVATTADNLVDPNCNISDGVTISLTVNDCGIALSTDLLSFNGNLMNGYGILSWSTSKEEDPVFFELERSDDGSSFTKITTVQGKNNGQSANYYAFTDPQMITNKKWYRLLMKTEKGKKKYSNIIQLGNLTSDFEVENVVNPFGSQLLFNIVTIKNSKITVELLDMQGKIVKSNTYLAYAGSNSLRIADTDNVATGIYTLRIRKDDKIINKKVMKRNN